MNLTGTWWIDYLLIAAAVLGALGVIWRKFLKPLSKWIKKSYLNVKHAIEIGSTLIDIAGEFTPNGGGSLRDVMDRVETQGQELQASFTEHSSVAEEIRVARDAELATLTAAQNAHFAQDAESFAEVHGAVATVQGAVESLTEIVTRRLEDRTLPAQVSAEAITVEQGTP